MTNSAPPSQPSSAAGKEIRLKLFGRTDVGQIREHNEDNFFVADLTRKTRSLLEPDRQFVLGSRGAVLGVCDGMGGAAAGEVASQLAVDIIFDRMSIDDPPADRDAFARRLVHAVEAAGLRIFSEAKVDRARRGMGTTATVAALIDEYLFFAQVGDSRAYILRGDRLVQVTRDQSLVNQLIEAGQLTEAEAETFEHNNIILQALGTADTVQVDLTFAEARSGDTLMLCSDGLSGMVRFDELREVLLTVLDPLEACRVLTEKANQAGGHDNITVIVAKLDGDGLCPPSPNDELRYRKYPLPEDPAGQPRSIPATTVRDVPDPHPAAPPSAKPSSQPPAGDLSASRVSDHGPSRSKVANTFVGGAELGQAALAAFQAQKQAAMTPTPQAGGWREQPPGTAPLGDDPDPIFIPTSNAPAWMVGSVVLTALALALVAGYYLLR